MSTNIIVRFIVIVLIISTLLPARAEAQRKVEPHPELWTYYVATTIHGVLDEDRLEQVGCTDLWIMRNALFGWNTYEFQTKRGKLFWEQMSGYRNVTHKTRDDGEVYATFGLQHRHHIELIKARERTLSCRKPEQVPEKIPSNFVYKAKKGQDKNCFADHRKP